MRIGIYSPYLDSFGGGERYVLSVAEVLSAKHEVDLLLDKHQISLKPKSLIADLEKHLNLDLSKVNLKEAPMGKGVDFFKRLLFWRKYDLLFYLTDGSIFYSTAKKNIIHFQVPFKNTSAKGLWGKFKLSSWNLAICNSKFTEEIIKNEWPLKTEVIYPPVEVDLIKPLPKKNYILSVGRFNSFLRSKKHEVLINLFRKMYEGNKLKNWQLHLAGSLEGEGKYLDELVSLSKGAPIIFHPDVPFKRLVKLYGESSIYWHAAGFEENDPVKMEHFGITTVEAMAGSCVPVVINKGGQPEIVEEGASGLLWNDLKELEEKTLLLIKDPKLRIELGKKAALRAKDFSKEKFQQQIERLAYEI